MAVISIFLLFLVFYPSARWARRGIVVPFVRRRLRRSHRRMHSFGYYTNMVQQIKFIQTFNPSQHFFTQGHRLKVKVKDWKKKLLTR